MIEDGDMIEIDIPEHKINVLVSDEELNNRKRSLKPFAPQLDNGYLKRYAKLVTSGMKGAILE